MRKRITPEVIITMRISFLEFTEDYFCFRPFFDFFNQFNSFLVVAKEPPFDVDSQG